VRQSLVATCTDLLLKSVNVDEKGFLERVRERGSQLGGVNEQVKAS
jgi:hypothetical protein